MKLYKEETRCYVNEQEYYRIWKKSIFSFCSGNYMRSTVLNYLVFLLNHSKIYNSADTPSKVSAIKWLNAWFKFALIYLNKPSISINKIYIPTSPINNSKYDYL